MTCIVAFYDKDKNVVLAGDKCSSNGNDSMLVKRPKVFKNKDFMIGYTTSFRMGQLLEFKWIPPGKQENDSTDKYLYVDVIDSIKKCFQDNWYENKKADHDGKWGNFILCYAGRIFYVENDLQLCEPTKDFGSVGSGCYHATGALHILLQYESDRNVILDKLFETVSYLNPYVSREYDVVIDERS